MSDVSKTVILALFLLAAIVLVFGGGISLGPFTGGVFGGGGYRFVPSGTIAPLAESVPTMFAGSRGGDTVHVAFAVPFSVNITTNAQKQVDLKELVVEQGIIHNVDKHVIFSVNDTLRLKGGILRGTIIDTNEYGALIIQFNGKTVVDKIMKPGEDFEIGVNPADFLANSNTLDVKATSSGWRVWAPATYMLNLTFTSGTEIAASRELRFTVPNANIPVAQGRLAFRADRGMADGDLIIGLNGEQIYRNDLTSGYDAVDFRGDLISQSSNALAFRTSGDADYGIKYVDVSYVVADPSAAPTQTFMINATSVKNLPGTIEFKINDVVGRPTGLRADIVSANGKVTRVAPVGALRPGNTLTVPINSDDVALGENRVSFVALGSGGYEITGFAVKP